MYYICGVYFIIYIFSDIRGFQCTTCLSVFSTLDYVKSHTKSVHGTFLGPDYYHCPHCNYSSQIQSIIERHSSSHHRNASPCKCENTRNNRNKGKDMASRVSDEGKCNVRQIRSNKDDGGVRSKGDYSKDIPYTCTTCEKTFIQQGDLTRHQRVHTGARPYKCTICGKTFTQQGSLDTHQRVHTGVKSYVCNTCGKAFGHQHHLTLHQRIHTAEKPYTCIICGQSFRDQSSLTRHNRIHTGEKPYTCKTCSKSFTFQHHLTLHNRIHTGEKPYTCKTCSKSFTHQPYLTVHNRIHTGEKPYSCNVCEVRYSDPSSLRLHMKSKHKPVEE